MCTGIVAKRGGSRARGSIGDQAWPDACERGRLSVADYEPPDALPKTGWRSWLLTTLAGRSGPKVDMVLAAGLSRSTTPIDPTLDVAGSR